MAGRGYTCQAIQTDTMTEELERRLTEFSPDHIVFPILEMEKTIPLHLLKEGAKLYTGVASDEWLAPFRQGGFGLQSYLQEEFFIWRNAQLTAEAFLAVYYSDTERTVSDGKFHVAGYGRVGKVVADLLATLGADVTVIARADAQLGEAIAKGFQVERLTDDFAVSTHCLVNTIPAKWLTLQNDSKFPIFDLASAPGCLTDAVASEYYKILPGLPGKYFPFDAALALADALERIHRR